MVNSLHYITSRNGQLGTQDSKIDSRVVNLFFSVLFYNIMEKDISIYFENSHSFL
jgi:hypothetical protein